MARYTGPVNKRMRFLGLEIAQKPGKNRMSQIKESESTDYTNLEKIKLED